MEITVFNEVFMAKKPVSMTPELQEEICLAVSTSPYMLEELCEENQHWPSARIIYRERIINESFGKRYAIAKQAQIEVLVSRIFMLARKKDKDDYLKDKDGIPFPDGIAVWNKRHEIDSIKWLAAKLAPKIYGMQKDNDSNENDFMSKYRKDVTNE